MEERKPSVSTTSLKRTQSVVRFWKKAQETSAKAKEESVDPVISKSSNSRGRQLWKIAQDNVGNLRELAKKNPVAMRSLWQVPHTTEWWRTVVSAPHRRMHLDDEQPLPLHPAVIPGKLQNGMQVMLLPNVVPPHRLFLRLVVRVGSLHERDDELGYAHLVEHCVFRTTTNFKAGEIDNFIRSIGADIGADANAATSFASTTYDLMLPFATAEERASRIKTAVRILGDFASEAQFLEADVQKEKAIVLEEWRRSQSLHRQARQESFILEMDGMPQAKRLPIGTEASITGATAARLQAFYRRNYQPQLMTLVVVGDMGDPNAVISEVQSVFGSIKTDNSATPYDIVAHMPPEPTSMRCRVYHVPDVSSAYVRLSFVSHITSRTLWASQAGAFQTLAISALNMILEGRMEGFANDFAHTGVIEVSVDGETEMSAGHHSLSINLLCAPDRVSQAVKSVWLAIRSLREQKVLAIEASHTLSVLDLMICDGFLAGSELSSSFCRDSLTDYVLETDSFVAPTVEMQLWEKLRGDLTPAVLHEFAAKILKLSNCVVNVELPDGQGGNLTSDAIRDMLNSFEKEPLPEQETFSRHLSNNVYLPQPEDGEVQPYPKGYPDGILFANENQDGSFAFVLHNGMQVVVTPPEASAASSVAYDEDPFPVKCSMRAIGDGLIETFMNERFEQYLAAQLSCTLAASVGLAGLSSTEFHGWCQANKVGVEHIGTDMLGRKIEIVGARGREEHVLNLVYALFTSKKKWDAEIVANTVAQLKMMSTHMQSSALSQFEQRVVEVNTCHNSFYMPTEPGDFDVMDLGYAEAYFRDCFQQPTDFKVVLHGNFGKTLFQVRKKIAEYLCAIPCDPYLDTLPLQPEAEDEQELRTMEDVEMLPRTASRSAPAASRPRSSTAPAAIGEKSNIAPADMPLSDREKRINVRRSRARYCTLMALKRFHWQVPFPNDIVDDVIYGGNDSRSEVCITFPLPAGFDDFDLLVTNIVCCLLQTRLMETLRNQMGGTYCVSVAPNFVCAELPGKLHIRFTCAPENVEQLAITALEIVGNLQFNGASAEEVTNVLLLLQKEDEDYARTSSYWTHSAASLPQSGLPKEQDELTSLRNALVQRFTNPDTCRSTLALLLPLHQFTVVVMLPSWMRRVPAHEVGGLTFFHRMREEVLDAHVRASIFVYGDIAKSLRRNAAAAAAAGGSGGDAGADADNEDTAVDEEKQIDVEIQALSERLERLKQAKNELKSQNAAAAAAAASAPAVTAAAVPSSPSKAAAGGAGPTPASAKQSAAAPQIAMPGGAWFWKSGQFLGSGSALTGRKKRFMVIKGNEILYFKGLKGGLPVDQKGSIPITQSSVVQRVGKRLLIKNTSRTWDLEAVNEQTAMEWFDALSRFIVAQIEWSKKVQDQ
eukprot:m.183725 g.183725  ORF g.183725 m.183725 type:complete len:1395 (-) comp17480_c0_seq2:143-4327(-)